MLKIPFDFQPFPDSLYPDMTTAASYNLKKNLALPINQRLSLSDRLRKAAAQKVASNYAIFRDSLGNLTTKSWDTL